MIGKYVYDYIFNELPGTLNNHFLLVVSVG